MLAAFVCRRRIVIRMTAILFFSVLSDPIHHFTKSLFCRLSILTLVSCISSCAQPQCEAVLQTIYLITGLVQLDCTCMYVTLSLQAPTNEKSKGADYSITICCLLKVKVPTDYSHPTQNIDLQGGRYATAYNQTSYLTAFSKSSSRP